LWDRIARGRKGGRSRYQDVEKDWKTDRKEQEAEMKYHVVEVEFE
jgi:hypothetical protein